MAEEASPTSALDNLKSVAGIASNIAVMVGVVLSVLQLTSFVDNSKRAAQSAKLGVLREVKTFLEHDEGVRRQGMTFLKRQLPGVQESIKAKVTAAGSGEAYYLSEEMTDFAAVHYHYEQMGALVKLGYIEFPLIFEIISFPDGYMAATEPIRKVLSISCRLPRR